MKEIGKSTLWVEKYRPQNTDDLICSKEVGRLVKNIIEKNDLPNLLLYGRQGTGKTATAISLIKTLGYDYLYINGSLETSIDTIKYKVQQYSQTKSMMGNKKAIVLDECLDENETVRIGTIDNWKEVPLKELKWNEVYPVVSFNPVEHCLENDEGEIISEKDDELYEVELESGKKIIVNSKHPFMIMNDYHTESIQKSVDEGLSLNDKVVIG